MPKQQHPIACVIPKIVKIRNVHGEKEEIVAFPAFLFEVVEKFLADEIRTE